MENKIFKKTAVWNKKCFDHFGIHESLISLYGNKKEEIQEIEFKISDNQTLPIDENKDPNPDYWGWFSAEKNDFTMMIYPKRFLLNMCFPYGLEACENKNEGKAYRIEIIGNKFLYK